MKYHDIIDTTAGNAPLRVKYTLIKQQDGEPKNLPLEKNKKHYEEIADRIQNLPEYTQQQDMTIRALEFELKGMHNKVDILKDQMMLKADIIENLYALINTQGSWAESFFASQSVFNKRMSIIFVLYLIVHTIINLTT
jgi:hypothetical protein